MTVPYFARYMCIDSIKQGNVNGLRDMLTNGRVDNTQSYVSMLFLFVSHLSCFVDSNKCLGTVSGVPSLGCILQLDCLFLLKTEQKLAIR